MGLSFCFPHQNHVVVQVPGGGGATRLSSRDRGVPPALSKSDPVAITLMAQKTPYSSFEINTEFNLLVYGVIITNLHHVLMVFIVI